MTTGAVSRALKRVPKRVPRRVQVRVGRRTTLLALCLFCAASIAFGAKAWAEEPQRQPLHLKIVAAPFEPFAF